MSGIKINKGVTEFYLWGKAELEDMLYLPKNDRVLFTFFGISLAAKRRSKATDIKFGINNKNKLARILGDGSQAQDIYKSILIRDIHDENYPWKDKYPDFDKNPRWEEHLAFSFHPRGLLIHVRKYYAFVDEEKKEYDYTEVTDLVGRPKEMQEIDQANSELRQRVLDFWKHLPRKSQANLLIDGIMRFEDMLVIDEKGDILYDVPHIFIDSVPNFRPIYRTWNHLEVGKHEVSFNDEYKRVNIFPTVFPEFKVGTVHKDNPIRWDQETLRLFRSYDPNVNTLFDTEGKYSFLQIDDVIPVDFPKDSNGETYIKITYKYKTAVKDYLKDHPAYFIREAIERQVGRKVEDEEMLECFEFDRISEWALKNKN